MIFRFVWFAELELNYLNIILILVLVVLEWNKMLFFIVCMKLEFEDRNDFLTPIKYCLNR